jgi:uncharacterized membrane protein YhhN
MGTNGMPSTVVKALSDSITQIESWPFALLIGVVLVMLQLFLRTGAERSMQAANKIHGRIGSVLDFLASIHNLAVPVIVILVGVLCYSELGDQKNPVLMLRLRGFAIGFVAWLVGEITYKLFRKYLPKYNGIGDTQFFDKKDK